MEKASVHLTPVSLELGGKSPVIVDETADIALTARRLVWGKLLNAGQTCVAPDYVLVHHSREQALVEALIAEIRARYTSAPLMNEEWPHIINRKHFDRLVGLLGSGAISHGGQIDPETLRISPTILTDVAWDSPVMQEEIFGPILPVLTYRSLDEAIARIQERPKPLALYLFTRDAATERRVLDEVSFGGGCVNDTVLHLATSNMPFGGVGESGMGGYHGKYSFDTFSHLKSVLKRLSWPDVALRYAPLRPQAQAAQTADVTITDSSAADLPVRGAAAFLLSREAHVPSRSAAQCACPRCRWRGRRRIRAAACRESGRTGRNGPCPCFHSSF